MGAMVDDPALFVAEGMVSELDVLLLAEELGPGATKGGQVDLTLPFRAPSYISIGDPVVARLESGVGAPPELRRQASEFDFYQVELACSFSAAPGCRFLDARFEVALDTVWADGPEQAGEAIAYDLFPVLIEDARTVTVTSAVKPEFSFGYEPVSAKLALPSRERVTEQIRYASRIAAFDLRGTRPAWSFYRTEQHEINGPQRLFILVRKPRGSSVRAAFGLSARVQFVLGGQGFSPAELVMLFRSRDRAGAVTDEMTVPLC
jgi:hypothetical protein